MESIFDKYKEELDNEERLNITFANIYCEMFEQPNSQSLFLMFGKLCKVYTKKQILMALLDMYDMDEIDHQKNIKNLIVYFIKKRLDQKDSSRKEINLNLVAEGLLREYGRIQ